MNEVTHFLGVLGVFAVKIAVEAIECKGRGSSGTTLTGGSATPTRNSPRSQQIEQI
jgi:hypothetical protein